MFHALFSRFGVSFVWTSRIVFPEQNNNTTCMKQSYIILHNVNDGDIEAHISSGRCSNPIHGVGFHACLRQAFHEPKGAPAVLVSAERTAPRNLELSRPRVFLSQTCLLASLSRSFRGPAFSLHAATCRTTSLLTSFMGILNAAQIWKM